MTELATSIRNDALAWSELRRALSQPRYQLSNCTVPAPCLDTDERKLNQDEFVCADLLIAQGKIEKLAAASDNLPIEAAIPNVDMAGHMLWPSFVDCHTHLDKAHIWERTPNPDGTFAGAVDRSGRDLSNRATLDDVRRRMDFALRCAYAHGTKLMRTHVDVVPDYLDGLWSVVREVQQDWRGRIILQPACLLSESQLDDQDLLSRICSELTQTDHASLGCVLYPGPNLHQNTSKLVPLARDLGLPLDFHVDENTDPNSHCLRAVAETVLDDGFERGILCGHCCSLAVQPEDEVARTLELTARAGIDIVSLPLCNLYLQDRVEGRTPRLRALAPAQEIAAHGIRFAVASDNTRDPFYAYGDNDMLEVLRVAVRALHLDHPVGHWTGIVNRDPADMLDEPGVGRFKQGGPADFCLFNARHWSELMSRPQSDRIVVRDGAPIDARLPHYSELDDLMGVGHG